MRLTKVVECVDDLTGQRIAEIEWSEEDALRFPLCLSGLDGDCKMITDISVARGNVLLVDHGREAEGLSPHSVKPAKSETACEGEGRPADPVEHGRRFRPHLTSGPLTFAQPVSAEQSASRLLDQDPRAALPQIELTSTGGDKLPLPCDKPLLWSPRIDLISSAGGDADYAVEMDDDGRAHLRFGDGQLGKAPEATMHFMARYRTGNGPSGNVGAGSIAHIVFKQGNPGVQMYPRNPMPARGGIAPEPADEVRSFAPTAFRKEIQRAITPADYARLSQTPYHKKVQRANAQFVWTGSWYEVLVAIDPFGSVEEALIPALIEEVEQHLYRYRRMGHDVRVRQAQYVPLDLELDVCVDSDHLTAHVKRALLDVFGNRMLPGGRLGFFHPDRLTFGDGVPISKMVAIAQAVPGVESVSVRLKRQEVEGRTRLAARHLARGAMGDRSPRQRSVGPRPRNLENRCARWKMTNPCGCCEGMQKLTPADLANRPGLNEIAYRVGTHATFLETMLARLSDPEFGRDLDRTTHADVDPLKAQTTRVPSDASIALLDAWAVVADILTFYQERIANEGYLRTAVERRSVLELARLVGYKLRPGVASSVRLAFTLQKDFAVKIPKGTPVKSIPGQNELPHAFETSEDIAARAEWNEIAPRLTRPQRIGPENVSNLQTIWLAGTSTKVQANDRLLIVFKTGNQRFVRRVEEVFEDSDKKRTKVTLQTEEFTSVRFANAIQGVVRQRLAVCPELAESDAMKTLRDKVKPQAKLADLDDFLETALAEFRRQSGDSQTSQAELKSLADAAGGISTALSAILETNDAALGALMTDAVEAYRNQDVHAKAVESALKDLATALALKTVNERVTATDVAGTALEKETVPDAAFQLSEPAANIAELRAAWKVPLDKANAAILAAAKAAIPLLKDTAALGTPADKAVKDAFDKTQKELAKATKPGTPAADTAAQFDLAFAQASVANTLDPGLSTKIDEIVAALKDGLDDANTEFDKISAAIDAHQDLQAPKPADAARKKGLTDKVSQALGKVKTASSAKLVDQSVSLADAVGQIQIQSDAAVVRRRNPICAPAHQIRGASQTAGEPPGGPQSARSPKLRARFDCHSGGNDSDRVRHSVEDVAGSACSIASRYHQTAG